MEQLPVFISIVFLLTVLLTLFFLYKASNGSRPIIIISIVWMIIQSAIAIPGFYTITDVMPPRFFLLVLPPLLTITVLFSTSKGRQFIDGFNIRWLTYLSTVRIPVEIALFILFTYKQVPVLMTFEGRNFDILSGISALFIAFVWFNKVNIPRKVLLIWNIICLALLLNIVSIAILSAPLPFQQLSIDQPNVTILYFPFVLLPGFVVPAVLLSHLVSIRKLLKAA